MQNATVRDRDRHVYGFDLLRCAAALLVAAFHFTRTLDGAETVFPFGWVGVEIFFVISGYVIAYSAQQADPIRFLKSRFLRLYPAAWLVAAMSVTTLAIVPGYYWRSIQIGVFTNPANLLNSFALTGIGVSASYWTLPVELAFYGCVFALLLAGRLSWLRHLALVLTIYGAPYIALLALNHLRLVDAPIVLFDLSAWNALLLRHGPFFALGLYLFSAWRHGLRRGELASAVAAALLCLVEVACRATEQFRGHAISDLVSLPVVIVEAETVFCLALAAMAISLRYNAAVPYWLRRHLRAFGLATYPFYLAHEVLGGLMIFLLLRLGAGKLVAVTGAIVTVFAIAYVVAAWVEPAFRRRTEAVLARATRHGEARKQRAATLGAT